MDCMRDLHASRANEQARRIQPVPVAETLEDCDAFRLEATPGNNWFDGARLGSGTWAWECCGSTRKQSSAHRVTRSFHRVAQRKKAVALYAAVLASLTRSAINTSLCATSWKLCATLCAPDYLSSSASITNDSRVGNGYARDLGPATALRNCAPTCRSQSSRSLLDVA